MNPYAITYNAFGIVFNQGLRKERSPLSVSERSRRKKLRKMASKSRRNQPIAEGSFMEQQKLVGFYDAFGYSIETMDGRELYAAGNNPHESSSVVDLDIAVPLEKLQAFCDQTGREIAAEMGAEFLGAEAR